MGKKLIFSDVDGTLVHIADEDLQRWGTVSEDGRSFEARVPDEGEGSKKVSIAVRALPASSTGTQAFISERTLELVAELRKEGHLFVLISGARSSTFLERLPYLPAADAYVMENGGRIFFPRPSALTAAPIEEDLAWRRVHETAAPAVLDSVPPSERPGKLWDLFRKLEKEGWACDAKKYSTDFRVSVKKSGKTEEELARVIARLPEGLASSFNLGSADFYPATSGKDRAAQYLMRKFGFGREDTVSMGDDDNDLALAKVMGHTFIPGITAESVRNAVAEDPLAFTVAKHGAFLGTHEVLEKIAGLRSRSLPIWAGSSLVALSLFVLAASKRRPRRGFAEVP